MRKRTQKTTQLCPETGNRAVWVLGTVQPNGWCNECRRPRWIDSLGRFTDHVSVANEVRL